jgi:hypothetical protein
LNSESIVSSRPVSRSTKWIRALNSLCLQCSDQVCATISSSASVGSAGRPAARRRAWTCGSRKCACTAFISARSSESRRCFDSASSAASATSSETVSTIGAAVGSAAGTGQAKSANGP